MTFGYPNGALFYRSLRRRYPRVVSGSGVWLVDDEGKRYLDGSGGALVANLGHGRMDVAEAIARQAATVAYATAAVFTSEPAEALASELARVLPEPLHYSYFLCSGSEAVEACVKLARQYWVERGRPKKWKVIRRHPSYHGNTLTALSLSGREHYKTTYGPLLTDFPSVPAPDLYRHPGCDACTGEAVVREIERQGPETVAAFIAEPVVGSSLGAMSPEPGYYRRVRAACDANDVLFIADEVMAGMGRTGRWFSFEHFGAVPDLVALGKGISGGYAPLSAVVATRPIVETIAAGSGAFAHAQTYSHMPLACAAGLAAVRALGRERLVERVAGLEATYFAKLDALRDAPGVGDVRGRGSLAGVELVADRATRRPFDRAARAAERVAEAALDEGLVVWPNVGHLPEGNGDILMIGPAFTVTEDEMDEIVARLGAALRRALGR